MALNCLVFEKIAFLHYGDRRTNKQTDKQMTGCREQRLNKCTANKSVISCFDYTVRGTQYVYTDVDNK